MLHAITREVSPSLAACELTHLPRREIDLAQAVEQHTRYKALPVGDHLVYPAGFPRTLQRLERREFRAITVDISQLQKAEAGVTCLSILFDYAGDQQAR